MNYEKAYKEALERAKESLKDGTISSNTISYIEEIFPELKESGDERIRKNLIGYIKGISKNEVCEETKDSWIAWLEKQGEKFQYWKPSEEQLEALDYAYNSCPDTERGNYYEGVLGTIIDDLYKLSEKQDEQKPDKVEPKFKVGDWVVYNNDICQIVKREEGCNKLVTVFGIEKELVNERNLSTARLWSITDAKDGDVLSDGTTIFIFKDLLSDDSVMSYCDYDTDSGESDAFCPLSMNLICSKITPATKEQCEQLKKAMTDAGYTFDFEKKELNKIEQKPIDKPKFKVKYAGSEYNVFKTKDIAGVTFYGIEDEPNHIDYVKADNCEIISGYDIKESGLSIPTKPVMFSAWSEEDEIMIKVLDSIIRYIVVMVDKDALERFGTNREELFSWLKSLKDRYTWKPSEGQIKALEAMLTVSPQSPAITSALLGLYEQLKKLKGV